MAKLILDLFCGAGMASDGYRRAGFDVVGVDIDLQPDYPYDFIQANALELLRKDEGWLSQFSLIHASPPCQLHTRAKHLRKAQGGKSKYLDLLTPTLRLLRQSRIPFVVENVPGAPGMDGAVIECGSAYGLKVRRHRLFLSDDIPLVGSGCNHKKQGRPWGVYHVMGDSIPCGGRTVHTLEQGWEVMGVDRKIPWHSLKEGFPPIYTRHIGEQCMEWLTGDMQ